MADNIVFEHAGSKQALLDLQSSKHHQDPPIGNEHGTSPCAAEVGSLLWMLISI